MNKIKTIVEEEYDIPIKNGYCKASDVRKTLNRYKKTMNRMRKEVVSFFKSTSKIETIFPFENLIDFEYKQYKQYRDKLLKYTGLILVNERLKRKK